MSIEPQRLQNIIEAALLAFGQPLSVDRLLSLFAEDEQVSRQDIRDALQQLQQNCDGRSVELVEVASGFRYQARKDYAQWVSKLWEEKPPRYSRALLETLVLVAYRQPITRAEIEDIRGVSVSSHIMKTLQERDWVRVVGHKDVPGKPALYATTKAFLDYFNLKSLDELPSLMEIRDLDKISAEMDLQGEEIRAEQAQANGDALELLNDEDVERLLPDGYADHGDGIEDDTHSRVVADAETSEEETGVEETHAEETGVIETAVAEPVMDDTDDADNEVEDSEPLQDSDAVWETNQGELVQDEPSEQADESGADATEQGTYSVIHANDEALAAIETEDLPEEVTEPEYEQDAVIRDGEQNSLYAQQSADDSEEMHDVAAMDDLQSSSGGYRDDAEIDAIDSAIDTAIDTGNIETEYDENAQQQTLDAQSGDEQPDTHEPAFSTANYGLRAGRQDEQEQDESEFAEDERHPDRLPAAESNS